MANLYFSGGGPAAPSNDFKPADAGQTRGRSREEALMAGFYPESKFGGFTDVDGTVRFYFRVNALLDPSSVVLDVGCGRAVYDEDPVPARRGLRILRGKAARVIGIDVDDAGRSNPHIDEFRMIQGERWPVEDDAVDLIVCDHVMEHVPDPAQVFGEFRRVLRNGGHLCIRTPNKRNYIALISRLVPNRLHKRVLGVAQSGRKHQDVFPTLYRCNTAGRIRRLMKQAGFDAAVYGFESEPRYLAFSRVAYALGVLHQKLAPPPLRASLFAIGRLTKPTVGAPTS